MSSAPAPQFDLSQAGGPTAEPPVTAPPVSEASEPATQADPETPEPTIEYIGVIHLTRTWVQFGIVGFAVLCIVIGAVEALFGR